MAGDGVPSFAMLVDVGARRLRVRAGMAVLLLAVSVAWAQEVPEALAERVVREPGGGMTRVTLFSNRMVVVSVHPTGERPLLRRRLLDEESISVYRALLERVEPELRAELASGGVPEGSRGLLILRLPGRAPLTIHYDPSRIPGLALGRVLSALDDLQSQVLNGPVENEEVVRWRPAVGDRVELWGGGTAVVVDLPENDVVVLEHEDSPVRESVKRRDLPVRVRRVLSRRP